MKWKLHKDWPWIVVPTHLETIRAGTLLEPTKDGWAIVGEVPFLERIDPDKTQFVAILNETLLKQYEEWFEPIFEVKDWVSYTTEHLDVAEQLNLTGIITKIHNDVATIIRPGPTIFNIHVSQLDIATKAEIEKEILSDFEFYYDKAPEAIIAKLKVLIKKYQKELE